MNLRQCMLTRNGCYVKNAKMTPTGILVHTTGCNNPNLKRYVQPDDGLLGVNPYNNSWNRPNIEKCVNAMIGKLKDGTVATYQTLPWDTKPWGCYKGVNGSFNNSHIQFEICEDGGNDPEYMAATFNEAVELCVYLCKEYGIDPKNIVGHNEAAKMGYASNHSDPEAYWKAYGYTMAAFRVEVKRRLDEPPAAPLGLTDEECAVIYQRGQSYLSKRA